MVVVPPDAIGHERRQKETAGRPHDLSPGLHLVLAYRDKYNNNNNIISTTTTLL